MKENNTIFTEGKTPQNNVNIFNKFKTQKEKQEQGSQK